MDKLKNQYTINIDDNYKNIVESLAAYYQRKPREYLRLLLQKILIDEYAKMQLITKPSNAENKQAIFKL